LAQARHPYLERLLAAGQSVWYDNIRRGLIDTELRQLVAAGVRGVTSNPTIFERAIAGSDEYDAAIAAADPTLSVAELYERLALEDIRRAADLLRGVYEGTGGADGFVSLEVSPHLARDAAATVAEAARLARAVDRPNAMIKVPATAEGAQAIRRLIAMGVSVNVTLIFSLAQYERVIDAYVAGLEELVAAGGDIARVASVASFFVSRVDTAVDRALAALAGEEARALLGRAAVANAKLAYALFRRRFADERWQALAARGARPQRPLWASTGTKNPAYSDVVYVDSLVGPDSVNTMPPDTLRAALDHGRTEASVTEGLEEAQAVVRRLADLGVDLEAVGERLQEEGVQAFADSFDRLMRALRHTRARLAGGVPEARYRLGAAEAAVRDSADSLAAAGAVRRLWAQDASLYGPTAPAATGWLRAPARALGRLEEVRRLAEEVRAEGYREAVVLGMGGSSLTAEVLARAFAPAPGAMGVRVLDSTHPDAVSAAFAALDPARTLFVVASKSGTTTEAEALYRRARAEVEARVGPAEAGRRFVAVTDPGTPLEGRARQEGFRAVVAGDPDVGGRYSALTPFGLLPAALLGLELEALVGRARRMLADSGPEVPLDDHPGAYLGAVLGGAARAGRDKVTIVAEGEAAALAPWLEQLLAESTGKGGRGLVPVVGEALGDVDTYGPDRLFVALAVGRLGEAATRRLNALEAAGHPVVRIELAHALDLGGEFVRWQVATAVAAAALGVDPFDQPDVQASKEATQAALAAFRATGRLDEPPVGPWRAGVAVARVGAAGPEGDPEEAVARLLSLARAGDYVALMVYAPPGEGTEAAMARARRAIRTHLGLATTFGYGPRLLHSTGQLHKGGPDAVLALQVVAGARTDPEVPGWGMGFSALARAQALGDLTALEGRGRRLVRLEVEDEAAMATLAEAVERAARRVAAPAGRT
jgi:transaldolase/glucose-6-phosphate isomerase